MGDIRAGAVITRRQFAQGLAAPLAAAARKPNLLFVFSDEHRACSMPGEPYSDVQAPNLRQLARDGVSFRNCVSNYPVCSPYRAMLLTGRWPFETGIVDNGLPLRDDETSLGAVFHSAGYRTGYIGKWHLSPGDERGVFIPEGPGRQGFDDWHVWSRTNQHFDTSFTFDPDTGRKLQPKGYNCTRMTDTALEFIGANRNRPWMLMLSWNPPHPLFEDAPEAQRKLYSEAALRLRPNVRESPGLRRSLAGYCAHITALDAEMGRLLGKLEETGQAAQTIVVYTSDHGDMMGSQGFGGKRVPWEESCIVPFLVRYPGIVPRGQIRQELLSTIDIYPSLCALAGLKVPPRCAGQDLSDLMRGRKAKTAESALLMHIRKDNATGGVNHPAPLFRGVRTTRHTYAVREEGRWCLYDNREDPYQQRNLVGEARYGPLMRGLDETLAGWLKRANDPWRTPAVPH